MWQILVIILMFAVLGKPAKAPAIRATGATGATGATEAFQNEDTKPTKPTKPTKVTKAKVKITVKAPVKEPYVTSNHVSRGFVELKDEFTNPIMNCPQNYEIANVDILETQQVSEHAFGYTKNEYLDRTRFVDTTKLKEPLPVDPDFFIS